MFSQLFSRSTAIFRKAFGYRPIARFFATRSSFLCQVCQLRVSHFEGSVQKQFRTSQTRPVR
jgi:hypothetical protein